MTDIETGIMIKNMAREMVSALSVKNAGYIDKATAKKIVDELIRSKTDIGTATDKIMGSGYHNKMGFDEHENLLFEMKARKAR